MVHGYVRRIRRIKIPTVIKQVLFGFVHCPYLSKYILRKGLDDCAVCIDHQSLHGKLLEDIDAAFSNEKMRDDEHEHTLITTVMTSCNLIIGKSTRKRQRAVDPIMFESTVQFVSSILEVIREESITFFPMSAYFLQSLVDNQFLYDLVKAEITDVIELLEEDAYEPVDWEELQGDCPPCQYEPDEVAKVSVVTP